MIEFIFPVDSLPEGKEMAGAAIVSVLRNHGVPVVGFSAVERVLSGQLLLLGADPGEIRYGYLSQAEIDAIDPDEITAATQH